LGSLSLPDDGVSVTEYPVLLPACIQPSSAIPPTDNPVTLHLPATAVSTAFPHNLLTFSRRLNMLTPERLFLVRQSVDMRCGIDVFWVSRRMGYISTFSISCENISISDNPDPWLFRVI